MPSKETGKITSDKITSDKTTSDKTASGRTASGRTTSGKTNQDATNGKISLDARALGDAIAEGLKDAVPAVAGLVNNPSDKKKQDMSPELDDYYNEKVQITLIKDNDHYKDDVTVTLNGYNYTISRGVAVMVPRKVAEIIEHAFSQQMSAERYISELVG